MNILGGVLGAADIDDSAEEPPPEWIRKYGPEKAKKKFRIAMDARRASKDAPVYIDKAERIMGAIVKARASEASGGTNVTINVLALPPPAQYESIVEEDDEVLILPKGDGK